MNSIQLLADAFGRVREAVHGVVDGASGDELVYRLDDEANSISWLVWHLTRIQDDHVAAAAGLEQVWTTGSWAKRLGIAFGPADTGYGHGPSEVAAVQVTSGDLLTEYYDAVHEQTTRFLRSLADADLDRIVDRSWDPPVTLGVRLVSVIADDLEHAGQAAYVRGCVRRSGDGG